VLEDDTKDEESPVWDHYFNEERLKVTPGRTMPDNLEELIAAGEEADIMITSYERLYLENDVHTLFDGSPEPE